MAWTPPNTFVNGVVADATEVNENFTDLAAYADLRAPTAEVDTLPVSPVDGQVAYFQNAGMATDGVVWQFRYNSSSASSYKWEFVGGVPWAKEVATQQLTSSTSFVDLGTVGPSVTAPLAGEYIIRMGAYTGLTADNMTAVMSFAVGGTGALDADSIGSLVTGTGGATGISIAGDVMKTVSSAASAIVAKYRVTSSSASFENRFLSIIPVRVA